jgi:hypothetical protein
MLTLYVANTVSAAWTDIAKRRVIACDAVFKIQNIDIAVE